MIVPDNSIECVLGRLVEAVENIKGDVSELKNNQKVIQDDQREIKAFVDDQRSFYKLVWVFVGFIGSLVYFGRDIYDFIFKIKGH